MSELPIHQRVFASRAEELGQGVANYFAVPSFYNRLLKRKAAVLIGGRGTGKTMVLKYMALEYLAAADDKDKLRGHWSNDPYVGCYMRIDTNEVSSFKGKGISEEDWVPFFAHYVNLRLGQQIVRTLGILEDNKLIDSVPGEFYEILAEHLCISNPPHSLKECLTVLRTSLNRLARYVNNPSNTRVELPILINNGSLVFDLCRSLTTNPVFKSKIWFMLVDEYENMSEYQQRVVNTLIKANQDPCVFKVAMRPRGWWTRETLQTTESLAEPADFDSVNFEDDLEEREYEALIKSAFRTRLSQLGIKEPKFLNVEELLPPLPPEQEASLIVQKSQRKAPPFVLRIREEVLRHSKSENEAKELFETLVLPTEPLRTRVHLVLLDRGIEPRVIAEGIRDNSSRYKEWYRHNRVGTLFLLCREYKVKKRYAGFEAFVALSSKIMRHFITLFTYAWEAAEREGFTPESPRAFSWDAQSDGAHEASKRAVDEIYGLATWGPELSAFANRMGRIFEELHRDRRQSQPERNHFAIDGAELQPEAEKRLKYAVLYSVLQEVEATKLRDETYVRSRDYVLNRIYSPFYRISYRKMHKLEISQDNFEKLICGPEDARKEATSSILRVNAIEEPPEPRAVPRQLNFWSFPDEHARIQDDSDAE